MIYIVMSDNLMILQFEIKENTRNIFNKSKNTKRSIDRMQMILYHAIIDKILILHHM